MDHQTDSFTKAMAYVGSGTLLMANLFLITTLSRPGKHDSFFDLHTTFSKVNNVSHSFFIDSPTPSAKLKPEEVVAIQLQALQNNGVDDSGIEIVYNFASPANKLYTGSLEQFKNLIKNPAYEPMLNFQSYQTRSLVSNGTEAHQIVIITDKAGRQVSYLFTLSRQPDAPYANCWMTDSVIRLQLPENQITI